ncbi:MAG: hypothetical protein U0790_19735, partial [Isosphaeraceae bacterium]
MNEHPPLSPVETLVLARLLPAGAKGEATAKIQKDLEPLLGHRWSGSALTAVIDRALLKLGTRGLASTVAAPEKGKRKKAAEPKHFLTDAGRQEAPRLLGVDSLGPKTTWATLKKALLPAHALGLAGLNAAALKSIGQDNGFKAALLTSLFDLPLEGCPTLKQATNALSWKLLGVDSTENFTVQAVQKVLLQRALGDASTRPGDMAKSLNLLLASRLKARRNDGKEFRDALLRGWVDRSLDGPAPSDDRSPRSLAPPAPPSPVDLARFAEDVRSAARACPTGRFGDSKVFIAHVWRALRDVPRFREMDEATFKRHLAEANNARLLDLSRADLVQAMDPDDVRLSEVSYLNATFHFIRIDPERQ